MALLTNEWMNGKFRETLTSEDDRTMAIQCAFFALTLAFLEAGDWDSIELQMQLTLKALGLHEAADLRIDPSAHVAAGILISLAAGCEDQNAGKILLTSLVGHAIGFDFNER